ncbi:hypothetical protein ABIE21_002850 [Conyzicola nivalis]|uniref:DUF222 domain-containing protein n=1 Tax=Conyzicola nivalis TaxID=1477021 RepID=A0ABV2QQK2_9MICO
MTNVIDGAERGVLGADSPEGEALEVAMLATFDDLLSTVESSERIIGASMALRAARIDQLRLWSEAMTSTSSSPTASSGGASSAGTPTTSTGPHGWTAAVRGRRELVFELACALRIPERTAERLIWESSRIVHDLSETNTALRDGEISYRHAQVMIDQTDTLPDGASADFERELLPFAKILTVAKFAAVARKKRESLHPESITERHAAAVEERRVWVDPQQDGMAFLGAQLSAEVALAAYDRLTEIAMAQKSPDDARTLAQKRVDAMSDLLLDGDTCAAADEGVAGEGTGHGVRAKVLVTVPVLTLLGRAETPANLGGYGPIDPEMARRLAADAPSFARVLTDPVTSAILDFDRTKYAVPADLRMVLRVRDETCRAPGCNRAAARCDVDHSVDWANGGTTCAGNLSHLCEFHHNLKHHTRVRLRNLGDGRIEWKTPSGRTYVTHPANTVGSPPGEPTGEAPPGEASTGEPPGEAPSGEAPSGEASTGEPPGEANRAAPDPGWPAADPAPGDMPF